MCLLCSWSVPVWNVCIITLLTEIDAPPNHLHMQQSSTWMNLIAEEEETRCVRVWKHSAEWRLQLCMFRLETCLEGERRKFCNVCGFRSNGEALGMRDLLKSCAWPGRCVVSEAVSKKLRSDVTLRNYLLVVDISPVRGSDRSLLEQACK